MKDQARSASTPPMGVARSVTLSGYRAAVVGGGIAGLATALALARRGAEVHVFEKDPPPSDTEPSRAFRSWRRVGAPQVRHSHIFLGRLRTLLSNHYPDLLAALLAAGARELRPLDRPPPSLRHIRPEPGDEDLVALGCRRITFELVLRELVLQEPGVQLEAGQVVRGLSATPTQPPVVSGVRVGRGIGRQVSAHFVVDATGRHSQVPHWLAQLGARPPVEREEPSGIGYYTRFYRLRRLGQEPTAGNDPWVGDYDWVKYAVFPAEEGIFSITLAVPVAEPRLKVLAKAAAFDTMVRSIPGLRDWIDPAVAEPLGEGPHEVEAMGGLINRRRTLLDEQGPVVHRLFLVGDAAWCTNPLYGRGCAQAFLQADVLAQIIEQYAPDWPRTLREYERQTQDLLRPYFRASILADRDAVRRAQGRPPRKLAEQLRERFFREGVAIAMRIDPVVFRAFLRMIHMFEPPDEAFRKPEVLARTLWVMAQGEALRSRYGWAPAPDREATIQRCIAASRMARSR